MLKEDCEQESGTDVTAVWCELYYKEIDLLQKNTLTYFHGNVVTGLNEWNYAIQFSVDHKDSPWFVTAFSVFVRIVRIIKKYFCTMS